MEAHNDNSDTWIKLAAATANLVRYLESTSDHHPDGERNAPEQGDEKTKATEHDKAVAEGLKRIERFERSFDQRNRNNRARR